MNALTQKEIRLLLPSWAGGLAAAVVPLLLFRGARAADLGMLPIFPLAFGAVLMALSSFGREFGLHTFSVTLAQPIERTSLWGIKVLVLAAGAGLALLVWLGWAWLLMPAAMSWELLAAAGLALGVALTGGLWSSLLVRQVVGAFWIASLVPLLILMVVDVTHAGSAVVYPALLIYSVAGYLWARRLFLTAQESGWASGVVTLPNWLNPSTQAGSRHRVRRPFTALLLKELRLQQPTLIAVVWLFLLHLLVLWLRRLTTSWGQAENVRNVLEVFGGIWVLVPLIAGTLSISEERKLGTLAGQICLPISPRAQYLLKLVLALFIGGLLSGTMLWFVEGVGQSLGLAAGIKMVNSGFRPDDLLAAWLVFMGLTLAGFYASSLTRNIVQALVGGVVVTASAILYFGLVGELRTTTEWDVWSQELFLMIGWPLTIVTLLWLALRNFRTAVEHVRLWPRNLVVWAALLVAIPGLSYTVYHRVWELVIRLEPAPGKPILSLQPMGGLLHSDNRGESLAVLLPDGRLWKGTAGQSVHHHYILPGIRYSLPELAVRGGFAPGSNWVDVALGFQEWAAIRSDGTLWLAKSESWAGPDWQNLRQIGTETNWTQAAVLSEWSMLLRKHDGTLWLWGTNSSRYHDKWPGQDAFVPQQVATNILWAKLEKLDGRTLLRAKDGKVWRLSSSSNRAADSSQIAPDVSLISDHVLERENWRSYASFNYVSGGRYGSVWYRVGVRPDGTLWGGFTHAQVNRPIVQIGSETNWVAVRGDTGFLRALKADGTLWNFRLQDKTHLKGNGGLNQVPLTRMSQRDDWRAIANAWGTVTLSADGGLWYWEPAHPRQRGERLLAPSRKPDLLVNVFARQQPDPR